MIQTNCVNNKKRNISKSSWDFRYKFATRLRCAREHQKLTQSDVAGKLDITLQAYQNFESLSESNNREPKLEMVYKLSSILDCDIAYLMGENDDNIFRKDIANASEVTGLTNENIEKLNSLDNDNIEMLNILIGHNSFEGLLSSCWTFLHSHYDELTIMSGQYSAICKKTLVEASTIHKYASVNIFDLLLHDLYTSRTKDAKTKYEYTLIMEMVENIIKDIFKPQNQKWVVGYAEDYEAIQANLAEVCPESIYSSISFDELKKQLLQTPISTMNEIYDLYNSVIPNTKEDFISFWTSKLQNET